MLGFTRDAPQPLNRAQLAEIEGGESLHTRCAYYVAVKDALPQLLIAVERYVHVGDTAQLAVTQAGDLHLMARVRRAFSFEFEQAANRGGELVQ